MTIPTSQSPTMEAPIRGRTNMITAANDLDHADGAHEPLRAAGDDAVDPGARYFGRFTIALKNLSMPITSGSTVQPNRIVRYACRAGSAEVAAAVSARAAVGSRIPVSAKKGG